jgi:hypothetical protein
MFFSFVGGVCSVCTVAVLDFVPRWWVRESSLVHDFHFFILQIHTRSFETGWQGEMVQHREAFHGLEVQDVTEFDSD